MWPFKRTERARLLEKIDELEQQRDALNQRLEEREQQYLEKIKFIKNENRNAPMVFDFKAVNAFSVERIHHDGAWKTIVGYLRPGTDNIVSEWTFHCSIERHNEIAAAFVKYLEGKKSEVPNRKRSKR